MENNAKRAMVGVGVDPMDVSDLDDGQQRKEREADKHNQRESSWPRATIAAHPSVKCCQTQSSDPRPTIKNTQRWMHCAMRDHMPEHTQGNGAQTRSRRASLNCWAMKPSLITRVFVPISLAIGLATAFPVLAQDNENHHGKVITPDAPGLSRNHRLILKDGTYQVVRKYEIVGDRVRYLSLERGDWEEVPNELVDWGATRKWEQKHAGPYEGAEEPSPGMKEAEELDKEEAAERNEQKARMPEVAKGLELPDQDGVFVLDYYQGTPELVELVASDLGLNQRNRKGLATLNPLAGTRATMELDGAHAKVHLHVNDPAIYVSLEGQDNVEEVLSHALTVKTEGVKGGVPSKKHGAHSPGSGFAIVKADERRAVRVIGGIHMSPTGKVTQSEDVIPTRVEVVPGKHWLKLTPETTLTMGEYALVEILSPSDISPSVWDFRVDPRLGDNPAALGPILK